MENVFSIVAWLIRCGISNRRPLSNLSLQKLLYFAQGLHLAQFEGQRLFSDPIYAWKLGPVVLSVYRRFKPFGPTPITSDNINSVLGENFLAFANNISADNNAFLNELWEVFGNYESYELVDMTHAEGSPWFQIIQNNEGVILEHIEIPIQAMQQYFNDFVH